MPVFTAAITFITPVADTSKAILQELRKGDEMAMGLQSSQMITGDSP
jgi:hypothetical protein